MFRNVAKLVKLAEKLFDMIQQEKKCIIRLKELRGSTQGGLAAALTGKECHEQYLRDQRIKNEQTK